MLVSLKYRPPRNSKSSTMFHIPSSLLHLLQLAARLCASNLPCLHIVVFSSIFRVRNMLNY